jgi:hypothetical protein
MGSIFALEILVPCVLMTCLSFLFAFYIILISVCKFHISPCFRFNSISVLLKTDFFLVGYYYLFLSPIRNLQYGRNKNALDAGNNFIPSLDGSV